MEASGGGLYAGNHLLPQPRRTQRIFEQLVSVGFQAGRGGIRVYGTIHNVSKSDFIPRCRDGAADSGHREAGSGESVGPWGAELQRRGVERTAADHRLSRPFGEIPAEQGVEETASDYRRERPGRVRGTGQDLGNRAFYEGPGPF